MAFHYHFALDDDRRGVRHEHDIRSAMWASIRWPVIAARGHQPSMREIGKGARTDVRHGY
jgi:hypothetical protein